MTSKKRSRKIPKGISNRLLEASRYRCCLCRSLINPQKYSKEELSEALEKHHIIYFSKDGKNTYDNLLLVCANCHSKIHSRPNDYPVDKLKEQKAHWVKMKDVVPLSLKVSEKSDYRVSFSLESVNLQYLVEVGIDTTVEELGQFIKYKILQPLGQYDNNSNWSNPSGFALALRSAPNKSLKPGSLVKEIQLESNYVFVSKISVQVMPLTDGNKLPDELWQNIFQIVQEVICNSGPYYSDNLIRRLSREITRWILTEIDGYLNFSGSRVSNSPWELEHIVYRICRNRLKSRIHRPFRYDVEKIASEITRILIKKLEQRLG